MSTLRKLRVNCGRSQAALAARMKTKLWYLQAAEFGLGHGADPRYVWDRFPQESFIVNLAEALETTFRVAADAYVESCDQGDHQIFPSDELPSVRFSDLLDHAKVSLEELAQMSAIPEARILKIASGNLWSSSAAARRMADALQMDPVRLEVVLWGSHYRRTDVLTMRGAIPRTRPRRRGGSTGCLPRHEAGSGVAECSDPHQDSGAPAENRDALKALFDAWEGQQEAGDASRAPFEPPTSAINAALAGSEEDAGAIFSSLPENLSAQSHLPPPKTKARPAPTTHMSETAPVVPIPITLAEAREARGLTIRQMARECGLSVVTICKLEKGRTPKAMRPSTRQALAVALRVEVAEVDHLVIASRVEAAKRPRQELSLALDRAQAARTDPDARLPTLENARRQQIPTGAEYVARENGWLGAPQATSGGPTPGVQKGIALHAAKQSALWTERARKGHRTRQRRLHGLTRQEAAERCGLSARAYRRIEAGLVAAKEATIRKIARGFDLSVSMVRRICSESLRIGQLNQEAMKQGQQPSLQE